MKNTNSEMPFERFRDKGPESLSDKELLAIIIRTGTRGENAVDIAEKILQKSRTGDLPGLSGVSLKELQEIRGIGEVKAIKIKCIQELSRRFARKHAQNKLSFQNPASIADYYMEDMRHLEREEVRILMLDNKSRFLADQVISTGTATASPVSTREIFREALRHNASYLIVLHNHPSGDSTPSRQDIITTKRLRDAADLMNLPLLDHIIIGDREYTSLKDKGFFEERGC